RQRPPGPAINTKRYSSPTSQHAALKLSQWLTKHTSHHSIRVARRQNYNHWLEGISGTTGITPLFPDLPDQVTPYAFPLLGDNEGLVFHLLKLAGIPLWRWEDMAVTECPVANDYRLRLLQLPCHQGLNLDQIKWMCDSIKILMQEVYG
ncbi:hypothetical protein ACFL0R_07900, partial [Pseudomonadota bacterium]